jgi:hypothetical protein
VIYAIELMYIVVRKMQLTSSEGWPRANPFLAILLVLTQVAYATIYLVSPALRDGGEPVQGSALNDVSVFYYLAIGLSALTIWLILDRRRYGLDKKFQALKIPSSVGHRALIVLPNFLFAILLGFLASTSPASCIATFVAVLLLTEGFLRALGLPARWAA